MKIIIDIGHPAHVHYFKNFIFEMKKRGHDFIIIARDKDVVYKLLNFYKISYIPKGKGSRNLFGKFIFLLKSNFIILKYALKFKPDLFMGFASPYASQVSWLLRKPSIIFNDTEHKGLTLLSYSPFASVILSPCCFMQPLLKKQLFFDSYMEFASLHPKYFNPNESILNKYNIKKNEIFFLLRFVAWGANHDIGEIGFSNKMKFNIINKLSKYGRVLISSEIELPKELQKYQTYIDAPDLHHLLYFASLYIGEGSTTASECSMLGTPNIYVNSIKVGYCREQQDKYGICFQSIDESDIMNEIQRHIDNNFSKDKYLEIRNKIIEDKIDVTEFMLWFVENYPHSIKEMKKN